MCRRTVRNSRPARWWVPVLLSIYFFATLGKLEHEGLAVSLSQARFERKFVNSAAWCPANGGAGDRTGLLTSPALCPPVTPTPPPGLDVGAPNQEPRCLLAPRPAPRPALCLAAEHASERLGGESATSPRSPRLRAPRHVAFAGTRR